MATKPDTKPATTGSWEGLTKVVELDGCCKTVKGSVAYKMTAGKSYYIMGLVKEGGGGEHLRVGLEMVQGPAAAPSFTLKYKPMKIDSMFDKTKTNLKCGGYACRYDFTGFGGTKVRDLTNHPKYTSFKPDKTLKLESGDFVMRNGGDNMGTLIEGWLKAPAGENFIFYTERSDAVTPNAVNSPCRCHRFSPVARDCLERHPRPVAPTSRLPDGLLAPCR